MSTKDSSESKSKPLVRVLRQLRYAGGGLRFAMRRGRIGLRNWLLKRRRVSMDYVVMQVGGPLPERAAPPRNFFQRQLPLPSPPLSLEELDERMQLVADADNVQGIIFLFRGFTAGLATLGSFRAGVSRLQAAGKKVIVYTPYLDLAHYFAASAADSIVIPPLASFRVLGLRSELLFLKDALSQAGIEAEVLQITPYKSAFDPLARADMSPEQREQLNWLLDDLYDRLTQEMAASRNMDQEQLQSLIDQAPYTASDALDHGLVDCVGYEDELASIVNPSEQESASGAGQGQDREPSKARLVTWNRGQRMLLRQVRRPTRRYIGVLSLEGTLAMGPSRKPPIDLPIPVLGGAVAGEATIVQRLRRAERDRRMAALVLHVDSSGGSAEASDLIWRAVRNVAQKKPVVAYMTNVAASGGYYVCAPAHHILGHPLTVTGSIGVVTAHLAAGKLLEKLSINSVSISRGEHAHMLGATERLDEQAREKVWDEMVHTYERFKQLVAQGRELSPSELDPVCGGRVWTAGQAREHGLIDSFGDLHDAIREAARRADLAFDHEAAIRTVNVHSAGGFRLAQPVEEAQDMLRLTAIRELASLSGRPLLHMPFRMTLR